MQAHTHFQERRLRTPNTDGALGDPMTKETEASLNSQFELMGLQSQPR